MEIRDIIHGSIQIHSLERPIIDSRYFQRLRQIKQLGFAEYSFPGATHNRFIHSLGAMETATQIFDRIFLNQPENSGALKSPPYLTRFRRVVRLAALLHDIGHGPLSHTSELAMPARGDLKIPHLSHLKNQSRKATHEDFTLKMILDSGLTPLIEKAGKPYQFQPIHVAALIDPEIQIQDGFFEEGVDYRPILKQIITSELDADRMDYLRRDSLHTGVSYGQFDFNWIVGNLTFHINQNKCYLTLHHRALYAFEDFLISRYHMFLMIYFHHKNVIFDEMLAQYFESPNCEYTLPSNIEDYCNFDDFHLYAHLSKSENPWAQRIIQKKPYRMLVELHSGIPPGPQAQMEQKKLLSEIEQNLKSQNIHSLLITSISELSKYFQQPVDPIYVYYDNHYSAPTFIPIQECTDLFHRFKEKRSITRIYISPENYFLFKKANV